MAVITVSIIIYGPISNRTEEPVWEPGLWLAFCCCVWQLPFAVCYAESRAESPCTVGETAADVWGNVIKSLIYNKKDKACGSLSRKGGSYDL